MFSYWFTSFTTTLIVSHSVRGSFILSVCPHFQNSSSMAKFFFFLS